MPFKSDAQRRFMFAAEDRGELPKGTAIRWAKETPNIKSLPEKKKMKKTAAARIADYVLRKVAAEENKRKLTPEEVSQVAHNSLTGTLPGLMSGGAGAGYGISTALGRTPKERLVATLLGAGAGGLSGALGAKLTHRGVTRGKVKEKDIPELTRPHTGRMIGSGLATGGALAAGLPMILKAINSGKVNPALGILGGGLGAGLAGYGGRALGSLFDKNPEE